MTEFSTPVTPRVSPVADVRDYVREDLGTGEWSSGEAELRPTCSGDSESGDGSGRADSPSPSY